MSSNSYVPPFLRNKQASIDQATTEQPTTMERKNPFQRERRPPRRPYVKPFWQIEQEKEQLELEEKKKAAESGLENTIENFPALGGNTGMPPPTSAWTSARKFSELASEWKTTDDQQKEEEDREKNRENDSRRDDNFQLPRFQNMRRFAEPEDEYYEDADEPEEKEKVEEADEEKWTVVHHHKYRKPKPEIEIREEDLDDDGDDGGDGTVWGAPEDYETCWDGYHPDARR
jgi:hypothetical protein